MSSNLLKLKDICIAATLGIILASPALSQKSGRAAPPSMPPVTRTLPGDVIQDRTRDRIDVPDQDRLRDRDRIDTPDRDRLRDRDPLYLGTKDRLRTFDRDRDGAIDRSEFQQWHETSFGAADANGDGGLSLQEFQTVRLGPGPNSNKSSARRERSEERAQLRKTERYRLMDGDGNGIVTRTEYMKFGELNYLDADIDDDGKLTLGELQQFHRGW